MPQQRSHNPLIKSSRGAQVLSASQLPFFLIRPPSSYGVLVTKGRKTGKTRRRCVRVVRDGDRAYLVAIKGAAITGWAKNTLAADSVRVRLPEGFVFGSARRLGPGDEYEGARRTYCESISWFDYLTWANWMRGRPTRKRIERLLRNWFETGDVLAIDIASNS